LKKLVLGAVVCLSVVTHAQSNPQNPEKNEKSVATPQSIMQSAAAVKAGEFSPVTIIKNERLLSFDAEGRLTDTFRSTYRIERADELDGWGTTGTRYEPWHQSKPQINARVIAPDGTVHNLDPKTVTDAPAGDADEDIFSDARRVDAPLPALTKGAIVEEEIIVIDTQPFFSAGTVERVWFSRSVPVESTMLTVIHPQSLPLRYTAYLLPDLKVEKSVANGIETLVFKNARLDPDESDLDNAPSGEPLYPQVAIATGASWNAVAAAYAKATEPKIRVADVQALVTDADRKLPRDERIAKLLDRLHKKVRYTGIEFGESSLIPHEPAETLKHQFGDCKDKAAVLVTMLRAANVPAKIALLNADSIQAVPDLPGMSFNHAIVYVPGAEGGKDYWIDATSPFSALGVLPYADYGRAALIVDEQTSALTTIPALRSADNVHTEIRRFELAEDGQARIVEINQNTGPGDAWARNFAFTRTKDTRDTYQKYVRETYLSEKLGELKFDDPTDMTKPFNFSIEALKATRGSTDFERAVAAILPFDITDSLPNAIRYEQDKEKKAKTRRVDVEFYPSITTWRYEVKPPLGYKAGALPPNSERSFVTAKLSQKYEILPDGRIQATLTFDTGKGRLTPAEAEQMRSALAELRNASAILIGFDSEALSLINAGKVKEGLAEYQQMIAAHPKEALHQTQLAAALINLGLGERARAVAKQAIQLDPKYAKAHLIYAQVLERDLIGRRFGKGFDYQGAVGEYRAAKAADAEDKDLRANLAILLEHSPQGEQYGTGSKLDEALKEWAEIRKLDEDYAAKFENNVYFDLWYLDRLPELKERLAAGKSGDSRRQLMVAMVALQESPQAAIDRAASLSEDRASRANLLRTASVQLMRRRKYAASAALMRAAAADVDSPAPLLSFAEMMERTKPLEERTDLGTGPLGLMMRMVIESASTDLPATHFGRYYSARLRNVLTAKQFDDVVKYDVDSSTVKARKSDTDMKVLMDIGMGGAKFVTDGDDQVGYKITTTIPNVTSSYDFFVKENGEFKYVTDQKRPELLGAIVVDALDKGDTVTARKWLDWARDLISAGGDLDDPLSGNTFARFWTKGQQGDERALRRASIALLSRTDYAKRIADKAATLIGEPSESEKAKVLLLRARIAETAQRWEEARQLGTQLLVTYPESKSAAGIVHLASLQLKDYDRAEAVIQPFFVRDAKDRWALDALARVKEHRGDFDAAQQVLLPLIEEGTATPNDLNQFAWYSLFTKAGVDKRSLDAGERGTQLSKDNFAIMHTVASQYAEIGRGRAAHALILQAMDAVSMVEPTSPVWYTLARIAESYGESEAALALYHRVEKNDSGLIVPTATAVLAQRHMDVLLAARKPAAPAFAQTGSK
jgi:transglutaminase-like putative cysteine protease/tetratricopeptide (TPR) repeat protein